MPAHAPVPRLNLRAPVVLTGLCYRALAGGADPAEAALTERKLAHLQMENTELLKTISSLRIDVQTAGARALSLKHDAHQAALDLELFAVQHPELPRRRGLLRPRLTPEQRQVEANRSELAAVAVRSQQEAEAAAVLGKALEKELAEAGEQREQVQAQRGALLRGFQEQLAGGALSLVAAGEVIEARHLLGKARRLVRGDLMVATLLVLTALLAGGVDEALIMLGELKPVFQQHDVPVSRVLAALIGIARGRRLSSQEAGALALHAGGVPAFSRLAMLACAIDGWPYAATLDDDDPFLPTLKAVQTLARVADPPAEWQPPAAEDVAQWAHHDDLITRTMGANILLQLDAAALIPAVAGVDFTVITPPRRKRDSWPALGEMLGADETSAWPAAMRDAWRGLLGCHVLLVAREQAPVELFQAWLAESYNWPKGDFYWWVLSRVQDDPALLRNVSGDAAQLVSGVPV